MMLNVCIESVLYAEHAARISVHSECKWESMKIKYVINSEERERERERDSMPTNDI